ncbi:MAG: immunity 71 family protein [Cryobacterium sp.]|nr:immunity 71 family protein [Cryobacterium sp.]
MDYEQKQREAFYLTKKYSSLTWYAEIYRLWTRFCVGYEDLLRHPEKIGEPVDSWWEQNFGMFWGYAGDMEEGLTLLRQGDKARGYEFLGSGTRFSTWLYSRRFEDTDLSELGYRRYKADGVSEGIFSDAEKTRDMTMAAAIYGHTDNLRRDFASLPDQYEQMQAEPIAVKLRTPYGVPVGELPSLPSLDPKAPTVVTGDEVSAMGIWVVEPDRAHRDQTYCMAYLRPWAPAIDTVSEQEYEINTRFERTNDEAYRKDAHKFKDYAVRWRLLWRDDRDYSNGKVPPEEADYLLYCGEHVNTPSTTVRLRCERGQPCPQSGRWFTPTGGGIRRDSMQGDVMPNLNSEWGATIWQLET